MSKKYENKKTKIKQETFYVRILFLHRLPVENNSVRLVSELMSAHDLISAASHFINPYISWRGIPELNVWSSSSEQNFCHHLRIGLIRRIPRNCLDRFIIISQSRQFITHSESIKKRRLTICPTRCMYYMCDLYRTFSRYKKEGIL